MGKISRKDLLLISALSLLIAFLTMGVGRGQGKEVPLDDRHRSIYEGLKNGRSREACELLCATCHGQSSTPLPKNHPPKEQCLICHQVKQG